MFKIGQCGCIATCDVVAAAIADADCKFETMSAHWLNANVLLFAPFFNVCHNQFSLMK
jgi:hypothetical protein